MRIRPIEQGDRAEWRPLWDGYNAFYGRVGATALDPAITDLTWRRFFEPTEPVGAFVAIEEERIVGIVHYLFHRSTTRASDVCYLQDLFTDAARRGRGIGRALIDAVHREAATAGCTRVYWHTQATNAAGRLLYDQVAEHAGFIVYAQEIAPDR